MHSVMLYQYLDVFDFLPFVIYMGFYTLCQNAAKFEEKPPLLLAENLQYICYYFECLLDQTVVIWNPVFSNNTN